MPSQPFFARYNRLVLLAAGLLLPVILYGSQKASETNRNDVKDWLPENFPETTDFRWFQAHFENETGVLVSWEGCTLDDPRVEEFAQKIVGPTSTAAGQAPSLFSKVITGPRILRQLTTEPVNLSRDEALARLAGLLVGEDHVQTCAIVSLSPAGRLSLHAMVARLADVAESVGVPRGDVYMGGPSVDNVAIDLEGQKTLRVLVVASGMVGLLLSWWCMRRPLLTALVFFTAVYSAGCSLAIVYFTGGKMDAVLYSMPPVVYTAALSGAIHIINYYRNTVAETGLDAGTPGRALRRAWVPCTLSAGTTTIGLVSLYLSHLTPIKSFGLYAGIGVMNTLVILYTVVPSVLAIWPPKFPTAAERRPSSPIAQWFASLAARCGDFVIRRHAWVCVAFAVVALAFGSGIGRIKTSVAIGHLFSEDADIVKNYRWLESRLGGLVPMEVVVRVDPAKCRLNFLERLELVQRVQHNLEQLPEVASVMTADTFMPRLPPVKAPAPASRRGVFGALGRVAVKDPQRVRRDVFNRQIEKQRDDFDLQDYLVTTDEEELWRVSIRLVASDDIDYGLFVNEIKKQVAPMLDAENQRGVEGLSVVYTGVTPLVYKAQNSLLSDLIGSFLTAFLIMATVMGAVYRSAPAGLLVMFPNVWPMALIFGLLGYSGIVLDIGTMMTASVAMGVSVDDAAHLITWFRFGIGKGLDRPSAVRYAYRNAALAMTQSSIIVGFALAVFGFSSFVPTRRFGIQMLVLLACGLFADLVLMPAILAGPAGRFFVKRVASANAATNALTRRHTSDATSSGSRH